ncbi:MAG: hypothetical protein JNK72_14565 [Myxococcales bacterium]|nr:hypothetical protein [Myxococcales bacterium]
MSAALDTVPSFARVFEVVSGFAPASAEALERASLQRRFDRKYLIEAAEVPAVVAAVGDAYQVVLARDARFALYDTFYFDTPSLRSYHAHRRAKRPRFKLRVRNYIDRALSMLEYKEKTPRGDTRKLRWRREGLEPALTAADLALLEAEQPQLFDEGPLHFKARTVFHRLMLLGTRSVERATLDFNLELHCAGREKTIRETVVVEVKDSGRGGASPLVLALRQARARALPFSKYCMAVAMLGGERGNAFLPSIRAMQGHP